MSELRESIAAIRDLDLSAVTSDELSDLLDPVFGGWLINAPVFDPGQSIYRGRKLHDRPQSLSEVSYPDPEKVEIKQGRANRAGAPMFYAAADPACIYWELGAEVGDRLVIVEHKTTARLVMNRIGYTASTFARLKSERAVPNYGELAVGQYTEQYSLIEDFVSEIFCARGEQAYTLSAAIAEKMMAADEIHGLLYPTIPVWGNADNFALKPSAADTLLEPVHIELVEVAELQEKEGESTRIDEANTFGADGSINWLNPPERWTLQPGEGLIYQNVDGRVTMRNLQGEIVPPE